MGSQIYTSLEEQTDAVETTAPVAAVETVTMTISISPEAPAAPVATKETKAAE